MVNPALSAQLPHDGIDPWETSLAVRPSLELDFLCGVVDFVFASDQFGLCVNFRGEMPGNESTVAIVVSLAKRPSQRCLCREVHVSEVQLTRHRSGWFADWFLGLAALFNDIERAVIQVAATQGAKV